MGRRYIALSLIRRKTITQPTVGTLGFKTKGPQYSHARRKGDRNGAVSRNRKKGWHRVDAWMGTLEIL